MQDLVKASELLNSIGWLSKQPSAFRRLLLSRCRLQVLKKGAIVYRIGERPDGIYGVASGQLAVEIAPNEQGPHIIHLFRPGAWFGEAALFGDETRLVSVSATRTSHCLFLPRFDLEEIAKAYPDTWRRLGQILVLDLQLAFGALDDLTLKHPDQRIAAILLRLAGIRSIDHHDDPTPEIDVTHKDIAEISCLARSTVASHLDEMQVAGLISRGYGHIKLLDPPALRRRAASKT